MRYAGYLGCNTTFILPSFFLQHIAITDALMKLGCMEFLTPMPPFLSSIELVRLSLYLIIQTSMYSDLNLDLYPFPLSRLDNIALDLNDSQPKP